MGSLCGAIIASTRKLIGCSLLSNWIRLGDFIRNRGPSPSLHPCNQRMGMASVSTIFILGSFFFGIKTTNICSVINRQVSWTCPRVAESKYGDTFLVVTPFWLFMRTSNAELGSQITSRKTDFLKPVERYRIVNLFGNSILTQEGHEWRRHKKIVGPSFSEKSNRLVFEETLRQTESMVNMWASEGRNTKDDMMVKNTAVDTATLSLHVICSAGFGVPQLWPNEAADKLGGKGLPGFSDNRLPIGHSLSFKQSLSHLLKKLGLFVIFPQGLLSMSASLFRIVC
jgi:hypothetical protein